MMYFLNLIYTSYFQYQDNYALKSYIAYAFVNLIKNKTLGDRTVAPSVNQLKDILKLKRLSIRVYLTHDRYVETYVELYETFEEMKYSIIKFLDFPDTLMPFIGFYEVNETDHFFDENFVEDFVRVSDVISSWEYNYFAANTKATDLEEDLLNNKVNYRPDKSKIYLRFRYYSQPEDSTTLAKSIEDNFMICEIWRLIIANRIQLDKESLYNIIAMYIKMKYPKIGVKYLYAIINDINKALKVFGANSNLNLTANPEKILRRLRNHEEADIATLKQRLTVLLRTNPCYKTQHFAIYFEDDQVVKHGLSPEMIMLVNSNKIFLCKLNMNRCKVFRHDQIRTMHVNKDLIVFGITRTHKLGPVDPEVQLAGGPQDSEKFIFKCNQATSLFQTIKNYIQININGTLKNVEAKVTKVYKDVGDVVISQDLINKVLTKKIMIENINRFYKNVV